MEWWFMRSEAGFGDILENALSEIDTLILYCKQDVHYSIYVGDLSDDM